MSVFCSLLDSCRQMTFMNTSDSARVFIKIFNLSNFELNESMFRLSTVNLVLFLARNPFRSSML